MILAILWTIAFISISWYGSQARDSIRVSDLSRMKISLELFQLDSSKFPFVSNWEDILYSGSIVWNQGTFWESVFKNISRIDKIPIDPLTWKEYTYSTTSNRYEYQLWWIVEWNELVLNNNKSIANSSSNTTATAYIIWNYNWHFLKTLSWTLCNVLALPSIITNDTTINDLDILLNDRKLVYFWYKNLPSSFKTSKFKHDWWFEFIPNNKISYTDDKSCVWLHDRAFSLPRVMLLKWLQESYSWTILKNDSIISNLISLDIDLLDPSKEVLAYASTYTDNYFKYKNSDESETKQKIVNSSCKTILESWYSTWDWIYSIDIDWIWWEVPFNVYCDMTTDWWWWTLLFRWINPSSAFKASEVCWLTSNFKSSTNDINNYPVFKSGIANFWTECLYINNNTTWNNTFWWVRWNKWAHENSPLNVWFQGFSSVKWTSHTFWMQSNWWNHNSWGSSWFWFWERPKNHWTCWWAYQCASKVCWSLTQVSSYNCHFDQTNQKYIYIR